MHKMHGHELRVTLLGGKGACGIQRFVRFAGKFIEIHAQSAFRHMVRKSRFCDIKPLP
jgi:hypothetical protein